MVKRFITWLYIKYVLTPMASELDGSEMGYTMEIEFVPAEEMLAQAEANNETKH